ncbi:MAG: EAL domain-containing protein, partial [Cyanobacteria bacterium J06636_16]
QMDGYQVCRLLKADPTTSKIPVIFLSALDQTNDKVKAFGAGGVDYVPKPFQAEELLARVENHLKLRLAQAQIQELNTELEQRVIQRTAQLEQEIGERLRVQEEVFHMATHDSLTGLPNRASLMRHLAQILSQKQRESIALILLKCDHLQTINSSLGHYAVDQLLLSIVRRLQTCLDSSYLLAHYGEDTFAILVGNPIDREKAIQLAERLQKEATLPFSIENCPIYVQIRVGIVLCHQDYENPAHLLRDANTALYQARAQGVGKIQVFNPEMYQRALSFFKIQNELYRALEDEELGLVYQPIFSLADNALKGAEALVRWHHPQRGMVFPDEFIPVAEETELVVTLDRYILRQACRQIREWQERNLLTPAFRLQVNLSTLQLTQADFIDYLDQILAETHADCCHLALEITEHGLMQQNAIASRNLDQLKRRKITFSIDDFGTGYSCLSYLHSLKAENLKIDRSFINQMDDAEDSLKVICSIISLAHELDMTVTAEGVETPEQAARIAALGCEFGQGYFWSRPVNRDAIASRFKASYPRY